MNYQQVIADATKQITFQSVDADAATITVLEVGSGFSCFCAAVAATTAADADAAKFYTGTSITYGGPSQRALNHCHMAY